MEKLIHNLMFGGLLVIGLGLVGCASTSDTEKQEKVSTLPWNTPEKWERSAPLGGGATY